MVCFVALVGVVVLLALLFGVAGINSLSLSGGIYD